MWFLRIRQTRSKDAFTVIEALVVLAVVGVLAVLIISLISQVSLQAMKAQATANMRQLGQLIFAATLDRGGVLPGPLWPGQIPYHEPGRSGRLAVELAEYLDIPSGEYMPVDLMIPPAYLRMIPQGSGPQTYRTYVMNMAVRTDSGVINPWGSLAALGGKPQPLASISSPSEHWMMSDADQLHPDVRAAPWRNATPVAPVHGQGRLHLFFDGSVRFLK